MSGSTLPGDAAGPAGEAWCEEGRLLASMFNFPHEPAATLQDQAAIDGFCGMLARFAAHRQVRSKRGAWGRRSLQPPSSGACHPATPFGLKLT